MDQEQKLFRLAVDAIMISAHYERGFGWVCVIKLRRGDEDWHENVEGDRYDGLTTEELVEVIDAHLSSRLGV